MRASYEASRASSEQPEVRSATLPINQRKTNK